MKVVQEGVLEHAHAYSAWLFQSETRCATVYIFVASTIKLAILKGLDIRIFRFYVEQENKIKVHFFQVVLQLQLH